MTLDVWRRINQPSDPHRRQLTLLWTPVISAVFLRKSSWCRACSVCANRRYCLQRVSGPAPDLTIRGYAVKWSQEDTEWSGWRDSGETQAEFSIGSGRYDITIVAVVHAGPNVSAHITIPQRQDDGGGERRRPAGATRWISESDGMIVSSESHLRTGIPPVWKRLHGAAAAAFNLSWDKAEAATCGYTVEWCIPGDRGPCALRWMKVPAGSNMLSLPAGTFVCLFVCLQRSTLRKIIVFFMTVTLILFYFAGDFKAGCRFTFNIYGCTENGHRLLEIQTGYTKELRECFSILTRGARTCRCFYFVKMSPLSVSETVEAPNLGTFRSDSLSVTLEWHYDEDDEAQPAFITGYLVTVQEVQQDALTGKAANVLFFTKKLNIVECSVEAQTPASP